MFILKRVLSLAIPILCFIAVVGTFSATYAQSSATSASIAGVIADPQGAVIPGAKVTITSIGTNNIREVMSGEDGAYTVKELRPSQYEIVVTADGFKRTILRVELDLGVNAKVDVNLNVDTTNVDVIEVRGSTLIQEGKTESSINQDSTRIDGLPINRRSFLDFALTSPRVTMSRTPAQGITSASGISFNGQSSRRNNVTIDGVDNNSVPTGNVRATFSQDAVQEFQVVSDSYSAEFGRAVGGVINIVTKGGSNDYHGSIFFIDRNDKLSTRDAFSPFKPRFSQYQSGVTLSGPIKKDKAFLFASFERLSIKQNSFITISDSTINSIRNVGFPVKNGPVPFGISNTTALFRGDFKVNANDNLSVRFNYGGEYDGRFEPFGGLTAETATQIQRVDEDALAINNIYVSAPLNLVNETRFLFSNRKRDAKGVVGGPHSVILADEGVVNFGPPPSSTPFFGTERVYQFVDNVSLSRGRNQIKTGIDLYYFYSPGKTFFLQPFATPQAAFLPIDFPTITGNPALPVFSALQAFDPSTRTPAELSFLGLLSNIAPGMFPGFPANVPLASLPLPLIYVQSFGNGTSKLIQRSLSTYIQDEFRLRPNLLIKGGLRYDINRSSAFPKNNGNFSPRVGFNYAPKNLNNLRVHGFYGIFFARELVGLAGAVNVTQSKAVTINSFPFPFSALIYSSPNRMLPGAAPPTTPGFITPPQLTTVFEFDKNLRSTYAHEVSFGADYYLNQNTSVSVNYNFVRGLKIFQERNVNPIIRPQANQVAAFITGRLDPTRGDVVQYASNGDSYYHGVTFSVERRFTPKINFLAFYTLSKAIDNFFDIRVDLTNGPVDPLNIRAERGLSTQDVRHRFSFSGTWDLSYTKNIFLRDFRLATIINVTSGVPYNLLAGVDLNQSGDAPPSDRPTIGAPLGRNVGIQPGFAGVDMRLTRRVYFHEKFFCEGFIEAFNLFNKTNISDVNNVFPPNRDGSFNLPPKTGANGRYIATPNRYVNAFAPRQLQVGIRLNF